MTGKLHTLWREKRRETLLCGVIFVLAVVSLLVNMRGIGKKASRFATGNTDLRKEVIQKQQELQELIQAEHEFQLPVRQLEGARMKFWLTKDGKPQHEFRRRIEQCAKGAGVRLKTVGTLQTLKLTEGLNACEIMITADVQLKEMLTFLQRLAQESLRSPGKTSRSHPTTTMLPIS